MKKISLVAVAVLVAVGTIAVVAHAAAYNYTINCNTTHSGLIITVQSGTSTVTTSYACVAGSVDYVTIQTPPYQPMMP